MMRSEAERAEFVRSRTTPEPVPLCPEITIHTATALTPLWHATAGELERWDASPFWAFPWAGGQALARHLLDHPEATAGRAAFDFASGSGLVAIAAARAGAARVAACDRDPFAATAIRLNAALNGVAIEAWDGDWMGDALEGFDLVLAGDIFYERPLAERGLAWLRALAGRGARVLVGDPGRIYSPHEGLREIAVHDVPTTLEIEDRPVLRTWVLEVLPG
jgi:predicted nicotinamide N-methyase